ncbi:hypothetical protein GQ53DRAFT_885988 [Thozetella sp. PMI_491]|nr:hypothetical protein GQ53DRAFT_885988 [Thozetella sp. PMI_491]
MIFPWSSTNSRVNPEAGLSDKEHTPEVGSSENNGSTAVKDIHIDAPNISLNIDSRQSFRELWLIAVVATLLQFGVLVYSGFATYYPAQMFLKNDLAIATYAYPSTAIGTLVLVFGMLLCANVVESSTEEKSYEAKRENAQVIWLQKAETSNSRTRALNKVIRLHPLEFKAVAGTIISLSGFVVQFIGLRGMLWSASIAQLFATVAMAILRAWVRRNLAELPGTRPLLSGHEMDWLALTLSEPEDLANSGKWDRPRADKNGWDWKIATVEVKKERSA